MHTETQTGLISTKTGMCPKILVQLFNIKYHENLFSDSRVATFGQRDNKCIFLKHLIVNGSQTILEQPKDMNILSATGYGLIKNHPRAPTG